MLSRLLTPTFRAATRPLARGTSYSLKFNVTRGFASSSLKKSADHGHGHHEAPPQLYGPGGKPGEVPTDFEQATGLERFELLHDLEGEEAFDLAPLKVDRLGTIEDPIKVWSIDTERIVGCNGFPVDSHDTLWMVVRHNKRPARCQECGCVYALDYHGAPLPEETPENPFEGLHQKFYAHKH